MKISRTILLSLIACLALVASAIAGGSGDVKLGYIFLDETGNMSVNRSTFNDYEGAALSLENFRYSFANGMLLRTDLKNITLNNRNLSADFAKPGLFDLKAGHSKFRRIYDFDGGSYTKREHENVSLSFHPIRFAEVFGGGSYVKRQGTSIDLYDPTPSPELQKTDYKQSFYNGGIRLMCHGAMVEGEYKGNQFRDNLSSTNDQDRTEGRVAGSIPVPKFEWIVIGGGFRHFESKFKTSDFMISSNRGWGSAVVELKKGFSAKFFTSIDRTSSDSDYTATDNVVTAGYLGYTRLNMGGVTFGYQHDVKDQFEEKVLGNSLYGSGWVKPTPKSELRAEYGTRAEDVKEGFRLIGDQDFNRYRFTGKYRFTDIGNVMLKYEGKVRKNDDIGSKVTFNRVVIDGNFIVKKYGNVQLGYSYANGKYENRTQGFDYVDHLLYGDVTTKEYRNLTLGGGATYYRSKRDLDVESFNVRCSAAYRLFKDYRIEAIYNVYNFDDFLVRDQYYTANVVEINLIRGLSL